MILAVRRGVLALLAASMCAGSLHAAVTDFSDLWWNGSESGWGMQLVRGGDVTFATLFVYDAQSHPTFFTATLGSDGGSWLGPLYATSGPYYGDAFDASKVSARPVGVLTFTPSTSGSAQLQYTVDGVVVTKAVTRQTLRYDDYTGSYPVTVQRIASHCPDAASNGDRTTLESIAIAHTGTTFAMDWTLGQRSCHLSGAYVQSGKLGAAQTSYACADGESGDLALFELTRFQGHSISNGCDYRGRISGFVPE